MWKTFPEMNVSSAAVCWKASLCSRGNYSFHLLPNMKNMHGPPCSRVTVLGSLYSWRLVSVDIWFKEIRPLLCKCFIRPTDNQMKNGLRFEKPGCWDWKTSNSSHSLLAPFRLNTACAWSWEMLSSSGEMFLLCIQILNMLPTRTNCPKSFISCMLET